MKYFVFSALTVAALFAASVEAAPFSNGTFETGSPTGGSPLGSPDNSTIPSWSVGGTNGTIEFNSNGDNGQNAQGGSQFISFGHNTTTGGTLSQTFDTVVGAVYTVNYYVSRIQGGTSSQAMSVTALNASTSTILNLVATSIPTTNNLWVSGTALTFTATSTSTILRFTDITAPGGGGDSNWALDTVSVTTPSGGPVAGVPETGSSVALLACGLAGLLAGRRFLRRSSAN